MLLNSKYRGRIRKQAKDERLIKLLAKNFLTFKRKISREDEIPLTALVNNNPTLN